MTPYQKNHVKFCTKIFVGIIYLGGIWSLCLLPWEKQQNQISKKLQIVARCPNISTDMETTVTIPIENAIRRIPFVTSFFATTRDSVSTIDVDVRNSINHTATKLQLISAVQAIHFGTPQNITLEFEDLYEEPNTVFELFLSSPVLSFVTVSTLAKNLVSRIDQISEVQKVSVRGLTDNNLQLEVNLKKLQQVGISYTSLIDQIYEHPKEQKLANPAPNTFSTALPVVIGRDALSLSKINTLLIHGPNGNIALEKLLLSAPQLTLARTNIAIGINQQDGIQILIHKKDDASTLQTVASIQKICTNFTKEIESINLSVTIWKDSAIEIKKVFWFSCGFIFVGLLLASMITTIFWGIHTTLWSLGSFCFSFSLLFCVIKIFGSNLYFSILTSAILSSGLIFVHCALTVKKIQHQQEKFSFLNNILFHLRVTGTVILGLFAIVYFLKTQPSSQEIPMYLIAFLGVNILTCCVFLPILGINNPSNYKNEESKFLLKIVSLQKNVLKICFQTKRSYLGTFSGIFLMVLVFQLFQSHHPPPQISLIKITGDFYKTSSIVEAKNHLNQLEVFLGDLSKLGLIRSYTRLNSTGSQINFDIFCKLSDTFFEKTPPDQFINDLQKECTVVPMIRTASISLMKKNSTRWEENDLSIEIMSDNVAMKNHVTSDLVQYLRDIQDVIQVSRSDESISELIFIEPTLEKIFLAGISVEDLQKSLLSKLKTIPPTNKIFIAKNYIVSDFDETAVLKNLEDSFLSRIQKIEIPTRQGKTPLRNLANIYKKKYPNVLLRKNGKETTVIKMILDHNIANQKYFTKNISEILKIFSKQNPQVGIFMSDQNNIHQYRFQEFFSYFFIPALTMLLFLLLTHPNYFPSFFTTCIMWIPSLVGIFSFFFFQKQIDLELGIFYAWITYTGFLLTFFSCINSQPNKLNTQHQSTKFFVDTAEISFIPLIAGSFLIPAILNETPIFILTQWSSNLVVPLLLVPILGMFLLGFIQSYQIATND